MFSTMKFATITLLSLTSLVSALPNTPAGYGTTTTTKSKSTTTTSKTTTSPTTSCSYITKTDHSTGYTTITTYKDVTTWIPTTIKSDIPHTYTTKSCSKETGVKTETRPVTKPYTTVSTGYSKSETIKAVTKTYGSKSC